jgi:hypothetical protein
VNGAAALAATDPAEVWAPVEVWVPALGPVEAVVLAWGQAVVLAWVQASGLGQCPFHERGEEHWRR